MGKYNSYPEYNHLPTGLLSSAPSSWDIKRLKYISSINDDVLPESTPPDSEFNYVDIGSVSVDKGIVRTEPMKFEDAPSRARRKVKTGDVIVSTVRTYLKAIAAIDRNADSLVVSTGFCVIRPRRGVVPRYCGYLMQAPFLVEQIVSESVGVSYPAINASQIANMAVPLPTEKEQTQIAAFLDCETAKIDRLIVKQQQLIELLQEKRQAVISHAVTKGLNPDAPMKDSGVEWLGEVPEHWKARKLKYIFKIRKRISGELGHDILAVTQKGIKVKDIESGEGQLSMDYSKYQIVEIGDFAMNHMDLLTGWVDIAKFNGVTSPDYRVFTIVDALCVQAYMLYLLQMGYKQKIFYAFGQGSSHLGRWRLPTEAFKEFVFPCPPTEEQQKIASFIENEHTKINKVVEKCSEAIDLLKERRTTLISAAVTGKIDVRDQVPQDVEEAVAS